MNFFLQIFALMAGIPVLILAVLIYKRYKNITVIFYGLFMLGIFSFIMNSVIVEYKNLLGPVATSPFLRIINSFFANLGSVTFFFSGPVLIHSFFKMKIRFVALFAGLLVLFSIFSEKLFPGYFIYSFWGKVVLVSLYMLIIFLWKFRTVTDPFFRRALKVGIIILGLNIPFMILPIFRNPLLFEISQLGISLNYVALNGVNIFYCFKYYAKEVGLAGSMTESIPGAFITRYGITPRETEIIKLLLKGDSVKDLGEALFISPKTVSNHIHNIYQKTDVNNRVQLVNLIKSASG